MRFTILGGTYDLDRESIIGAAKRSLPEPIDGRHKYFAMIDGRRYPIKQLLACATGLRKTQFTAQYAQRILRKLGFDVEEYGASGPRPHFRSNLPRPPVSADFQPGTPHPDNESQPAEEAEAKTTVHGFAVTLERDEDGFVVGSCPALPGCHSQGRTRQEALRNVAEAIRGYTASMKKHGEDIPDVDWEVVEVEL